MTKYFKQLRSCITLLKSSFITNTVLSYPTSNISQLRLRSFRLLSHAEIEYYVESTMLDKIREAKNNYFVKNRVSDILINLLAYSDVEFPKISTHLNEVNGSNDISFRINKAINAYEYTVKRNNGIKEENIIPLLLPLGIQYSMLDQVLFNNLSSFGKSRGDTAHQSSKVQVLINPQDEINVINYLLEGLESLDFIIERKT